MENIIIGITQGDINGIGYEVILKSFTDTRILDSFTPVIYGSTKITAFYKKQLELNDINLNNIKSIEHVVHKRINIINCVDDELKVELGKSTKEAGKAAYQSLKVAVDDLKNNKINALVTAPINKDNIQSEEFQFAGHTEFLGENFEGKEKTLMMLVSGKLRIAVATGHIPLKDVAQKLTTEKIVEKLEIMNTSLKKDFRIIKPRIAVLGLNPHSGDNGLIGKEEQEIIIPAIKKAEEKGILCFGTYPSDGFFGSRQYLDFDGILAMYHDQGLIPFKTLAMDNGVNYTAGLSIVRTSPDHGTAYDIAGKNIASKTSFLEALYLACDIFRNRKIEEEINKNPLTINSDKNNQRYNKRSNIE